MRTYEILDANNNVVGHQEHDDSFSPMLLQGQTARVTHVDGELLSKKSQHIVGPETTDGATTPVPPVLVTVAEEKDQKAAAKAERDAAKSDTK